MIFSSLAVLDHMADIHIQPQSPVISMSTPPLSPNIIVPEDMEIIQRVLDHAENVESIIEDTISDHPYLKRDDPNLKRDAPKEEEPVVSKNQPEENSSYIRTIDELYTHCEQLVETLSQASEELKLVNTYFLPTKSGS